MTNPQFLPNHRLSLATLYGDASAMRKLAFGVFLLLIAFTFLFSWDYGASWDSLYRMESGERNFQYYQALLQGDWQQASEMRPSSSYTGLFDLLHASLRRVSPFGWVETSRLLSMAFGLLAIAGTWKLGSFLGGPVTGLIAAAFLLLMPRFYGHLFINPKDIPLAALYIWSLWALLRCFKINQPLPPWPRLLLFALLAGLAMSCRIGGLILFAYAGLAMVGWYALQSPTFRFTPLGCFQWWRPSLQWLAAFLLGMLVLCLFWPAAHQNPFAQTAQSVAKVTDFGWFGRVFFLGRYYEDLPWFYLPFMLLITLPPVVMTAGALSIGNLFCHRNRFLKPDFFSATSSFHYLILLAATIIPVLYIIGTNAQVYDGIRHVLFLLPPIAVMAAHGMVRFFHQLKQIQSRGSIPLAAGMGLLALFTIVGMIRLHPYQYIYYNFLSGGVKKASASFETDYWGTAYREAYQHLYRNKAPELASPARVTLLPPLRYLQPHRHNTPIPPAVLVSYYVQPPFVYVPHADPAEFYIATTRFEYHQMVPLEPFMVIQRSGAPLAAIFDVSTISR